MKRSLKKNRSGFTLIEALMATMLIGIAVSALLIATVSQTQANAYGIDTSTAEFLVEEIRCMMMPLEVLDPETGIDVFGAEIDEVSVADYDDLDDFDEVTFNPPIDVSGAVLNDFSMYSQIVTVENVDPADLTSVVADHASLIVRVSVSIEMNGKEITSGNWIRARF
jgi:prepilin-type N-terminal cleavage/methylation domain-containing protein